MAIHTLKTPLRTVSKPDFSPQLGLAFSERAIWSNQSTRLFAGLAAIISGAESDGYVILYMEGKPTLGLPATDKLINKYAKSPIFQTLADRHYYATTALVEMVTMARKIMHINANAMWWLMDDNPMAFEIIHTVGRAIVSIDCAGVFSHHRTEVEVGQPIAEPQTQLADLWYKRAGGIVAYERK